MPGRSTCPVSIASSDSLSAESERCEDRVVGRDRRGVAVLAGVVLAVAGCSAGTSDSSDAGELFGWGTVIESSAGSGVPLLCLAGVQESAPPGCAGDTVALHGLDWASVPEALEVGGTRWFDGTFYGTWDGSGITLTRPFQVGDQAGSTRTETHEQPEGSADPSTVRRALDVLSARVADDANHLAAAEFVGTVNLVVVYDDGAIQTELDRELGEGVVVVRSAMRALSALEGDPE